MLCAVDIGLKQAKEVKSMGRKWRGVFIVALVVALLLGLAGSIAAAPVDNPGKGPPAIDKIVFVHYPKDTALGRPEWLPPPPGRGGKDECPFKWRRVHWDDSAISPDGVPYLVNLANSGAADAEAESFLAGIQASFQTWEDAPVSYMDFTYDGPTTAGISSLDDVRDGFNVVGWANISEDYPNAIAVCIVWYYVNTKHIVEVDTALNSDPQFAWWQNPAGEKWTVGNTEGVYDVDVQNIMTHEAGHWLMLLDLYDEDEATMAQTMYGISAEMELQKRSLECGDEAGIQKIYPE